jgi:hypothetical protein
MKTIKNWTSINNDVTGKVDYRMAGKIIQAPTGDWRENENGTKYKLCSIQVPHPVEDGVVVPTTAQIFENNLNKLEDGLIVGQEYLTTCNVAVKDGKTVFYFKVSHLQGNAQQVTAESLGLDAEMFVTGKAPAVKA